MGKKARKWKFRATTMMKQAAEREARLRRIGPAPGGYPQLAPREWRWPELQGDRLAALETFDSFSWLRSRLHEASMAREDVAGCPIPIEGEDLIIEKTHPLYEAWPREKPAPKDGTDYRSCFYSTAKRCDVVIYMDNGKVNYGLIPAIHSMGKQMRTLGCSFAWGIEQEARALQLLANVLRHHQMKTYLLTGMFLEYSKRSGVCYVFRKLRPTIALRPSPDGTDMYILAALCMHPIAYYAQSWAGAMCPTDDVLSHLMMMRGDEPMFWRRSNQHPAHRPEAGI